MQTITLGKSSLVTSRLAYGCWRIFSISSPDQVTPERDAAARKAVTAAYEAATVREAVQKAVAVSPDLVLLDARLPDGAGSEACRQIKARSTPPRVLFLSSFSDEATVLAAIQAGADGFILKDKGHSDLIHAIKTVAAGGTMLDPLAASPVMGEVRRKRTRAENPMASLNARQIEIVRHLAEGLSNKDVASRINLSEKTVRNYVSEILDRLGLESRSQVVAAWLKQEMQ